MRVVVGLCIILASCGASKAPQESVMAQRQAVLDGIADKCGMPRDSWRLVSEDTLLFQLGPKPDRAKGRCLLKGLEESNLPVKFRPAGKQIRVEPVS